MVDKFRPLLGLDTDLSRVILVVGLAIEPSWGPTILGSLVEQHADTEVFVNYVPHYISLEELARLNTDIRLGTQRWWQPEAGALILLLRLAIPIMVNLQYAFTTLPQYGYFIVDEELFKHLVNERILEAAKMVQAVVPNTELPTTAEELLAVLERCSGSTWPLRAGPPIRREGNILCVDIHAATQQLDHITEFPRGSGQIANVRADHFEEAVQEVINSSPWRPPDNIQVLRRRTLRYDGKNITDIDAVGSKGSKLLVVSCKSFIYSAAYDTGDFAVVRNASSMIEDAVNYWNGIRSFLMSHPIGSNYDFSGYDEIIAVVCTVHPIYVKIGVATQSVDRELMVATSISELRSWLSLA